MNRAEWISSGHHNNEYRQYARNALKQWRAENNITEKCAVHHRDDTEETRKYNSEHYERWGFNDNGEFIEGQYVIFMTCAEHAAYHNKQRSGENSPLYGRKHSTETCQKISESKKGKKHSEETRAKISASLQGENNPNYGKKLSDEARTKISTNNGRYWKGKKFSEEHRTKISSAYQGKKVLYAAYKNNGGTLKWNEFQKALSNGAITFEMQPISVYTKEINK